MSIAGPWPVALRLAWREVRHTPGLSWPVALLVGMPVFTMTVAMVLWTAQSSSGRDATLDYAETGASLALQRMVPVVALTLVLLPLLAVFAVRAGRSDRTLALVAAIGADAGQVRRMVLAGAVVLGALASAVAAVAGVVGGLALARGLDLEGWSGAAGGITIWWQAAVIALAGTVVAVAAAWVPARRSGQSDTAAVLAGRTARTDRASRPVVGPALVVLGLVIAVVASMTRTHSVTLVGVVALLGGVVMTSGAILTAMARNAHRLGPTGRLATRDAARHRGRTAPLLGGVVVATAVIAAGVTFIASLQERSEDQYAAAVADGVVTVSVDPAAAGSATSSIPDLLRSTLPVVDVHDVFAATFDPAVLDENETAAADAGTLAIFVDAEEDAAWSCAMDPASACPSDASSLNSRIPFPGAAGASSILVDDGTLIAATGLPGADRAAAALREGKAVVSSASAVWADGSARLTVRLTGVEGMREIGSLVAPATHVSLQDGGQYYVILPPSALGPLGLEQAHVGYLATTDVLATSAQEQAAVRAVQALAPGSVLTVERGPETNAALRFALLASALVVALSTAAAVVALAAVESRGDLAVLAAVGAPPSFRRRLAATQAATLGLVGAVLGTAVGVAFAWVLVLNRRFEGSADLLGQVAGEVEGWALHVPWVDVLVILLVVPACAALVAYLCTRPIVLTIRPRP